MNLPRNYRKGQRLHTLVEQRTTYTLDLAEMSIFETHKQAETVLLDFSQPVLASMIQGKKVMHLREEEPFAFLPGESLMLPAKEQMCIDFPEADLNNPTKCLAMTVDEEKIQDVLAFMNDRFPKVDNGKWRFSQEYFYFFNDVAIHQIIHRLIFLFVENHDSKDIFVNMMLQELLMRIFQTESRHYLVTKHEENSTQNRLAYIINYIRNHLSEKISMQKLSQKAYMSESHFYRVFKQEMGMSPVDFVNQERLAVAANLLATTDKKVSEIYMICGFNSLAYFSRVFKQRYGLSPSKYQKSAQLKKR